MKSYLLLLTLLISVFTIGCEQDDTPGSAYLNEQTAVVTGGDPDVINAQPGDIYTLEAPPYRIIITDRTEVFVIRESCSGLDRKPAQDVEIGYTVFFKFRDENIEYSQNPTLVRPEIIEAYRPGCLDYIPE